MRVLGLMVMKNEADRYLKESLTSLKDVCDSVLVYDDQSSDESVLEALALGPEVSVLPRPDSVLGFEEHEGKFRQAAWNALSWLNPTEEDWVMSLDADEVLHTSSDLVNLLAGLNSHVKSARVRIHEVFDSIDGYKVRVDGYWGDITGIRLCRYEEGGVFPDKEMASGSLPIYASQSVIDLEEVEILHLGYARQEDRNTKYERYKNKPGHNTKHVDSILKTGKLVPWKPLA